MSKHRRILEIKEKIDFLTKEIEEILLRSGTWTILERLAVRTNIRRIEALEQELLELDKE